MYVCTTAHNHSTQKNVKHVYTCLQHNDNLSYKEQVYMHSTTVVTPTGLPNNQWSIFLHHQQLKNGAQQCE